MKELLAVEDMLCDTIFEKELVSLWKEFNARESIEAKIVKDADNLDVNLELREQEIQTASEKFFAKREKIVKPKLYTKTAKEYWKLIRKSDVHDWHVYGRNRFNAGDWKKI